jgi:hypothetical protein
MFRHCTAIGLQATYQQFLKEGVAAICVQCRIAEFKRFPVPKSLANRADENWGKWVVDFKPMSPRSIDGNKWIMLWVHVGSRYIIIDAGRSKKELIQLLLAFEERHSFKFSARPFVLKYLLSDSEIIYKSDQLVKQLNGRSLYFRPVIINGVAHPITVDTLNMLEGLANKFEIYHVVNTNKTIPRNYKKCHQMFHFPVFCADGKIYICCEGKGNPQFELTDWDKNDFRDSWLNQRHYEIYNKTRVEFCQPCRPNISNIKIQNILDDPKKIESLYL